MKKFLYSGLTSLFLFGSVLFLFQPDIVESDSIIFASNAQIESSVGAELNCDRCGHNEICVKGKCINLEMIERKAMVQYDNACSGARCNEGEACVAGYCFQPSRFSDIRTQNSCLNTECDKGQTCYRGVCHNAVNENGNPVECAPGEPTEQYAPPNCEDGYACSNGKCMRSRVPVSDFQKNSFTDIATCGSGMVRISGSCVSLLERSCRNCKEGEVCLGGECYGLTQEMGEPCNNSRCRDSASCISGICIDL